jgi:hypothetical protein
MPTNLNALIRYKRIDACLKNPYVVCSIQRLQEACTDAMGEFRGKYKLVSERTIREDIRVLRSNILGFNAPIEFQEGKYIYTDKDYSIFETPVTEVLLLKNIFKILLKERKNFADVEVDKLIEKLSIVTGKKIPNRVLKSIREKQMQKFKAEQKPDSGGLRFSLSNKSSEPSKGYYAQEIIKEEPIKIILSWDEIFTLL